MKPKESIRSAAETPITCLGRLAPLAAGGAGPASPRRRGLPLRAGTGGGFFARFAGFFPTPLCLPSTLSPFLKKGGKNEKKIFIDTDRNVSLAQNGPASLPGWGEVKNNN